MVWTVAILALLPGLASSASPAASPVATSAAPPPSTRAADDGDPAKGLRLAISATTERMRLPRTRGAVDVSVDALARTIRLRVSDNDSVAAVAAHIGAHAGALCPEVVVHNGAIELRCRSARVEAQITKDGKATYLDINELRGLPWRAGNDAAPIYHFDPWRVGMGQSCPGRSEAAQGECEFKDGHALQAAIHFRKSLDTSGRQLACVRLGDLAMGIGDPLTAGGWYRRAGVFGNFGRIARGRLCELDGRCLGSTEEVRRTYDAAGLPEPLRAESLMRAARAEAYAGRLPSAAHIIGQQIRKEGAPSICREGGEILCRRILLEAMRAAGAAFASASPAIPGGTLAHRAGITPAAGPRTMVRPPLEKSEREYIEELIETYLAIPSWETGAFAVDMAQAAAPLVTRLGAPAFAGNLLASLAPEVPEAQLSEHLLLAAETFMAGQNWARARIIGEYAQTRLGPKRMKTPRWAAVQRSLYGQIEEDEESPALRAALEAELATTLSDLKKARLVMTSVEGLLRGAHAAAAGAKKAAPGGGGAKGAERSNGAAKTGERKDEKAVDKGGDDRKKQPQSNAAATAPTVTASNERAKR